mmetsp:Transcript_5561/g.16977  ORF Transcript_5561/g.16977 Transcript_5561/m.16977 type:complete len:447 (+) Transcript_5561:69-1409(+)
MAQNYVGSVKSFNPEKGWGHIECSETFQIYGKDIFLLRSQLDGGVVQKGAQVSFRIVDNGRGPEAVDVSVLHKTGGHGTPLAPSRGIHDNSYVGVVKSFNPASGWGHIACGQTEEIYGKDMFFMKSQVPGGIISKGTPVQFSVTQGLKGPEAEQIRPIATVASSAHHMVLPGVLQHMGAVAAPWPPTLMSSNLFYGTVKSFNDEKGWGHITCPQTQAVYGKDMFVLRSALGGSSIKQGDSVQFTVIMGQKGPEAANVKVVAPAGGEASYVGTIKHFTEEKGWGFIKCDATKKFFNKDVFLMRSTLKGRTVKADDIVSFKVEMGIKGPQATELTIPPHGSIGFEGERGCTFSGTIKNFNTEKGFGFIEGVMVREVFGKDIFVHKRELGEHTPSPGDVVCFSVELDNNGQPQAKYVSFGTVPSHPFGLAPAGEAAAEPPSGAAAATEL